MRCTAGGACTTARRPLSTASLQQEQLPASHVSPADYPCRALYLLPQDGRESCSAQFSPCSRRLSVATLTGPFNGMSCALAVFETASWQRASGKCSAEAAAALGCHGRDWRCGGVWSPDGRLFMYKGVDKSGSGSGPCTPGACDPGEGCMYVVDVVQGRLVAALPHVGLMHASQGGLAQAGWHPSSRGVVGAARSWRLGGPHAAGLQAAGLAVGVVPAPHCVCLDQELEEGSRFSADGSLLLVQNTDPGHHVVLGCAVRGLDIGFTPLHDFGPPAHAAGCEVACHARRVHGAAGGQEGQLQAVHPHRAACGPRVAADQPRLGTRDLAFRHLLHRQAAGGRSRLPEHLGMGSRALSVGPGGASGQGELAEVLLDPRWELSCCSAQAVPPLPRGF